MFQKTYPIFVYEIDMSRAFSVTTKNGLAKAGLIPSQPNTFPSFIWIDGIYPKNDLTMKPYQRCNKIPKMEFICFKTTLFSALNEIQKRFRNIFSNVYPRTFVLPEDFFQLQHEHLLLGNNPPSNPHGLSNQKIVVEVMEFNSFKRLKKLIK